MRVDEALRILEVSPSATPAEIKAAYRRMVKVCHPDRHALDETRRARADEALKRVVQAYQLLRHGVPAAPPPEPKKAASATPGSTFSVRQAPSTRRRRSRPRPRTSAGSWAWYVAVSLPALAALSLLLVLFYAGPSAAPGPEPILSAASSSERWVTRDPDINWAVSGEKKEEVRASLSGVNWRVQNPTPRTWSQCTAWVGSKWLSFRVLKREEIIVLPAGAFTPPLGAPDNDTLLELACRWENY